MQISHAPITRDELFDEIAGLQAKLEKGTAALEWRLETESESTFTFAQFDGALTSLRADFDKEESAAFRAYNAHLAE